MTTTFAAFDPVCGFGGEAFFRDDGLPGIDPIMNAFCGRSAACFFATDAT